MRRKLKKVLAVTLASVMIAGVVPNGAFASQSGSDVVAGDDGGVEESSSTEVTQTEEYTTGEIQVEEGSTGENRTEEDTTEVIQTEESTLAGTEEEKESTSSAVEAEKESSSSVEDEERESRSTVLESEETENEKERTEEAGERETESEESTTEESILPGAEEPGSEGTYTPEGASYSLNYKVVNGSSITITGISDEDATGDLVIPSEINGISVTAIGDKAFSGCKGFTGDLVIPSGVTTIGEEAFCECNGLTGNLVIPSSVTMIGASAFYCCFFTGDIVIGSQAAIGEIKNAFKKSNMMTSITGGLVIGDGVTTIGDSAFSDFHDFTGDLVIGNSVTAIGNKAFNGCKFTGNLEIPSSVTTIGDSAFYGCSGFTGNLEIPSSVTAIGEKAFYGCSGFTGNLVIGNGVTLIGNEAFCRCSGFTGSLEIPSSVTTIGDEAFSYGSRFKGDIVIGSQAVIDKIGNVFRTYSGEEFTGRLVIGDGVTIIGDSAFSGCHSFRGELVIGNSVTAIGDSAFSGCYNFTGDLAIPSSVTAVGEKAFYECRGFAGGLVIGNSVTTIGNEAFYGCSGFTGDLEIPSSVTAIGDFAFYGCKSFTGDLEIPSSVTAIGKNAFSYCSGFTGNLAIGEGAGDGVVIIGEKAFYKCSGFTGNLVIGNSVTAIGEKAFYECSGFAGELVIGNSVTTIGNEAFNKCTGFTGDLVIPDSVTTIGNNAFRECKFAGNLVIGNAVETIGERVFPEFASVVIPESVQEIGIGAIQAKRVTFLGKTIQIANGVIGVRFIYGYSGSTAEAYAEANGKIFVPLGAAEEYRVSSVEELKNAIGSNRRIILADGKYQMSGSIRLQNIALLTIEAEHDGKVEFLNSETNSYVFYIDNCVDIRIAGCIMGHGEVVEWGSMECGPEGYIFEVYSVEGLELDKCDLYGCGVQGLHGWDLNDIRINNCIMRDCKEGIIVGSSSEFGIKVKNCIFSGNAYDESWSGGHNHPLVNFKGDISFENCMFLNNWNTSFGVKDEDVTNCTFYNNAWDGGIPPTYGICLNGITWQMDGTTLKLGYPLQLDENTIKQSKKGNVLDYSDASLPWRRYEIKEVDTADGIGYGDKPVTPPTPPTEQAYITVQKQKRIYECGEVLNIDDLTVQYHDTDGTAANVTGYTTNMDTIDMSVPGTKTLIVIYNDLTEEIQLIVRDQNAAGSYTVIFDTQDHGTAPAAYENVEAGSPIQAPQEPAVEGYRFLGWYREADCKTLWNFGTDTVEKDTILYAGWEVAGTTCKVTFDLQGHGTELEEYSKYTEIKKGSAINSPTPPTAEGYKFTGWYKEADCKTLWNFETDTIDGDTILYAGWEPEKEPDNPDHPTENIPDGIWITEIKDHTYTGKAVIPSVDVYYNKKKLTAGRDYTITYQNNTKAATSSAAKAPTVIVRGKGNYSGTKKAVFTINKARLTKDSLKAAKIYPAGTAYTPIVTTGGNILKAGTDYTLTYLDASGSKLKKQPTKAGNYQMLITGKGSCEGEISFQYAVSREGAAGLINKGKATVSSMTFGSSEPDVVTLAVSGNALNRDTDYIVRFTNTGKKGTATATFIGIGNYAGTLKKTFKVQAAAIQEKDINVASTVAYEKGGAKAKVTVTVGGVELVSGTDYTVTYKNNTKVGNARVTVKGKGNYTGSLTKDFRVEPKPLTADGVQIYVSDALSGKKPAVTVYDSNGKKLAVNTDYKMAINKTTHTVTLTNGKNGLYKTESPVTKTYRELGKGRQVTSVALNKKASGFPKYFEYTGKEVGLEKDWLTVKAGKTVLKSDEFEILGYVNNIEKGTATVIIRGNKEYGGIKMLNFKIKTRGLL